MQGTTTKIDWTIETIDLMEAYCKPDQWVHGLLGPMFVSRVSVAVATACIRSLYLA